MNRKEVIDSISAKISEQGYKKSVHIPKTHIIVTDENKEKEIKFPVKQVDKEVSFNNADVSVMLDAFVDTIKEALMSGDVVTLRGLGTFYLNYRKGRSGVHPITKMPIVLEARYTPKFLASKELKMCAKIYEQSLKDMDLMSDELMEEDIDIDEDMSGIEEDEIETDGE